MKDDRLLLLTPLREALERITRKAGPLLADPSLLDHEDGQDRLDVICMQFLAAGEALKRLEGRHGLSRCDCPSVLRSRRGAGLADLQPSVASHAPGSHRSRRARTLSTARSMTKEWQQRPPGPVLILLRRF